MTAPHPHFPLAWTTIVEVEFLHIMIDEESPDETKLGPRPDQLHADLNLLVRATARNGLLAWLPDGVVVHCDWLADQHEFARRDGKPHLALRDVRAWAALPDPIAPA
jgi:hypothetical protein